jgi:hypothetical protein
MVIRLMFVYCGMQMLVITNNDIIIFQNYDDHYHRISDKYQNFINGPTNKNIVTFDLRLSVVSSIECGVFWVLYQSHLSAAYHFNLHS